MAKSDKTDPETETATDAPAPADSAATPAAPSSDAPDAAPAASAKPQVIAERRRGNFITRVLQDAHRVWKEIEEVVEGDGKKAKK